MALYFVRKYNVNGLNTVIASVPICIVPVVQVQCDWVQCKDTKRDVKDTKRDVKDTKRDQRDQRDQRDPLKAL